MVGELRKKTEVSHPPSSLHTFIYSSAILLGTCSVSTRYLNGIWTGLRAGNTEPIPNWYRHFPTSIHILSHTLTIRRRICFFCTFFARLHKKVYLCTAKSRMESAFGVRRCLQTMLASRLSGFIGDCRGRPRLLKKSITPIATIKSIATIITTISNTTKPLQLWENDFFSRFW